MITIDFNELDKDIPDLFKLDNKSYSFSECLYDDGLTGDINEEFENDY